MRAVRGDRQQTEARLISVVLQTRNAQRVL